MYYLEVITGYMQFVFCLLTYHSVNIFTHYLKFLLIVFFFFFLLAIITFHPVAVYRNIFHQLLTLSIWVLFSFIAIINNTVMNILGQKSMFTFLIICLG